MDIKNFVEGYGQHEGTLPMPKHEKSQAEQHKDFVNQRLLSGNKRKMPHPRDKRLPFQGR